MKHDLDPESARAGPFPQTLNQPGREPMWHVLAGRHLCFHDVKQTNVHQVQDEACRHQPRCLERWPFYSFGSFFFN
jgi:hypothetical protein